MMVKVLIKAFDILELAAIRNGETISLTEISEILQLNQATAANINKTLVARGYLEQVGKKKGYRLGPAAYRLTKEESYGQDLVNAASKEMEALTAKLNESCLLGVLRNYKRYVLHQVSSGHEIQVQSPADRDVYETASGRLLMAYLSEKELEHFVAHNGLPRPLLWEEADTIEKLRETASEIRKQGIVMTHLKDRYVRGFAVPVFAQEKVLASLSVFLPEYRCTDARRQQEIIQALKESAIQIGNKLGV